MTNSRREAEARSLVPWAVAVGAILVLAAWAILPPLALASVKKTHLVGTLFHPTGQVPTQASVTVTLNKPITVGDTTGSSTTHIIAAVPMTITLTAPAAVDFYLSPNVGATPAGTYYNAKISTNLGSFSQKWEIPDSTLDTRIANVVIADAPTASTAYLVKSGDTATGKIVFSAGPSLRVTPTARATTGLEKGDTYYDSTDNTVYVYNGATWDALKGNVTSVAGKNGITANGLDTTAATGTVTVTPTYGTAANTITQGNDARLSDARTPTVHASTHLPGGSDALTMGATATDGAATSAAGTAATFSRGDHAHKAVADIQGQGGITVNGLASTPASGATVKVTITYGTAANTACQGNDSRLSDARTPTIHATTHQPGGSDAMAVDAVAGTGSLRTLGTGSQQAAAGNDSRLSDARTPLAHSSTHKNGGSDEVAVATPSGFGIPKARIEGTLDIGWLPVASSGVSSNVSVTRSDDARLSDSRAPNGSATGDLTGSFPSPTVAKVRGVTVTSVAPTNSGQGLFLDAPSGQYVLTNNTTPNNNDVLTYDTSIGKPKWSNGSSFTGDLNDSTNKALSNTGAVRGGNVAVDDTLDVTSTVNVYASGNGNPKVQLIGSTGNVSATIGTFNSAGNTFALQHPGFLLSGISSDGYDGVYILNNHALRLVSGSSVNADAGSKYTQTGVAVAGSSTFTIQTVGGAIIAKAGTNAISGAYFAVSNGTNEYFRAGERVSLQSRWGIFNPSAAVNGGALLFSDSNGIVIADNDNTQRVTLTAPADKVLGIAGAIKTEFAGQFATAATVTSARINFASSLPDATYAIAVQCVEGTPTGWSTCTRETSGVTVTLSANSGNTTWTWLVMDY